MTIKEVTLFTNNIQEQRQFYKTTLGMEIIMDTPKKIAFKAGSSILSFKYKEKMQPSHLAFNIPYNAIYDALKWLKERTDVISYDDEYVTDFSKWKAKAIYFHDADCNIMEFIAREDIEIESDIAFSSRSIISISEMAIATDDIENIYKEISKLRSIPIFDGSFERFCALGNHEGLFILIDKNTKKWYPTDEVAQTSDFIMTGDYNFSFLDGKIEEMS